MKHEKKRKAGNTMSAPSPEMLAAAARVRKVIRDKLRRSHYGDVRGLFALDDYAEKVIRPVTYREACDGETPDAAEVAYQRRVYHEAMKHFTAFRVLLSGLADTGPSIRWVDGFAALRLMFTAEFLGDQLERFQDEMALASDVDNALAFEQAVRLAVTGMGPPFGPVRERGE